MPRNVSTHAAGVVITKDPVDYYVPVYARDGQVSTQYTMTILEQSRTAEDRLSGT